MRHDIDTFYLEGPLLAEGVNGDGRDDVALPNLARVISVVLGHGEGTFSEPLHFDTRGYPKQVAPANLFPLSGGAGEPDLIVPNGDGTISVFANTTP